MSCTQTIVIPIVGPQGPAGDRGATGPNGTSTTGAMGPVGSAGINGPAGPLGIQGVVGPAGLPGLIGPTGPGTPGATGGAGLAGPAGLGGPTGPSGGTDPNLPYAYLSITTAANEPAITIPGNAPIVFTNAVISPDFLYSSGVLIILTPGFYQINFGFNATAVGLSGVPRPALFALVNNGVYLGEEYAVQSNYQLVVAPFGVTTELTTSGVSASVITYLNAISILEMRNGFSNGQPITFQNTVNDMTNSLVDGAICAYMNVVRLTNI